MNENRPLPEELLKAIQETEKKSDKGSLKVFLGMAAGVGKTYAMLKAAQQLVKQHVNLLIGVINTHGRSETEALLQGLPILPLKKIHYKDLAFEEMDLDEILRLKPTVVLVDEFAHTNVPGCRHAKRWQDVVEILENGIDVYTTLNVQHIESLKDVVESISEVKIRESIPDSLIEAADYIEIVDLTPEELLTRLKEGKIYLGDKSELAAQNFFKEDRITALREILLRYAAEKVDHDLQGLMPTQERTSRWRPRERLMVAISHDSYSEKLIRTTRRLAATQGAPWLALYVDDGSLLDREENQMLAKLFGLARDLGAEVIMTNNPNIAEGINQIARQKGVTQIILGRRPKAPLFGLFYRKSVLDRLARECVDIDIHVIKQESVVTKHRKKLVALSFQAEPYSYVVSLFLFSLLSGVNFLLLPYVGYKLTGVLFLLYILFLSLFFRKGPIFVGALFCGLIWQLFFVPTSIHLSKGHSEDFAFLGIYLCTAIATGILVDRAREHQNMLIKRERTNLALFDIVKQISLAASLEDALRAVKSGFERIFKGSFEIFVKTYDDGLDIPVSQKLLIDEKEVRAASWVFENGKEAGWSTDTLPSSANLYLPIKSFLETVGVIVYNHKGGIPLTPEEKNFVYTVASQMGNYMERLFSQEKKKRVEQREQVEKMHSSMLNRISTIFQQPLLICQNAAKSLEKLLKNKEGAAQSLQEISKIDRSMNELFEILANVSAMAQLGEGMIPLRKQLTKIEDIIEFCCTNMKKEMDGRKFELIIEPDLPMIWIDSHLIELVLLNLLTNAIYYSPLDSTIEISAKKNGSFVVVAVSDEGKGIPDGELEAIFEKFYSLPDESHRGIGLGLSIAKTIAETHKGQLRAENRVPKGTTFFLSLPI